MGILEIESGKSTIIVGNSNEISDFIVDSFEKWYEREKENLNRKSIHTWVHFTSLSIKTLLYV
jgi:hypothetical protein